MAFSLLALFGCRSAAKASYTDLDVEAFARAEGRLVDVRTADEYAEGHLRGAVNVDYYASDFQERMEALFDKSEPLAIYCRSGRRSADAAGKLAKAGFTVSNLLGGYLAWTAAGKPVSRYAVETFRTEHSHVDITLIKHGTLAIDHEGISIHVDPVAGYGVPTDYAAEFPKADVILITHEHPDHLDPAAIDALSGDGTEIITTAFCAELLGKGTALANGDSHELRKGILLEAVPAYNTTPGREQFHPKGRGNGYVLTLDGLRIYIAGDTEDIPEMAGLKDIDIAFLPVNQPYTMTPEQCVRAAESFRPKVLIPYHFSNTDLSSLPALLPDIDVRLRAMQ